MVNSIHNTNGFKAINVEQKSTAKAQNNTNNPAAKPDSDSVAFQINTLRENIMSTSEINHARVEFLQSELASGRYQPDSLVIADKLLAEFEKNS